MARVLIRSTPRSIAWEIVTPTAQSNQFPAWTSYMKPVYDAVSGQSLWYNARSSSSIIFSTDFFAYASATRHWTRLGGTGTALHVCPEDDGPATTIGGATITPWPQFRHPIEQLDIDTSRNRLVLYNGVWSCAGQIGVTPDDLQYYDLNADPTANRWTEQDISAAIPSVKVSGSMVYVPVHDVFVLHGANSGSFPRTYVFGPTSGSLSGAQLAAGCVNPNEWAQVYAPGTVNPPQSYFSSLVYAPNVGDVFHFGHNLASEVWQYTLATKTWINKNPSNPPSEPATWTTPERLVSYISSGALVGHIHYRQTSHHNVTVNTYGDFLYAPTSNTWSVLSSTGTGPRLLTYAVFDPTLGVHGGIVAFEYGAVMWHGVIQ